MTKLFLKKTFVILFFLVIAMGAKAQIGFDYAKYDLGLGGAYNQVYGDAPTLNGSAPGTLTVAASFNYNQTPYVNYIFELQGGHLKGGDRETLTGRTFDNSFTALVFRGQLQAGELIDYSSGGVMGVLKNIYLSSGVGFVMNKMKTINRESSQLVYDDGTPYITPGLDRSNELFIPARVGYEFKIYNQWNQPSVKIDIGYQVNFDLSDNLDGFDVGGRKDVWTQISVNVKFALGGVVSYRKAL